MAISTLTTTETAAVLEVSPVTVWSYVYRGQLHPLQPGAKPLRFEESQVLEFKRSRMRPEAVSRLRALADLWRDA